MKRGILILAACALLAGCASKKNMEQAQAVSHKPLAHKKVEPNLREAAGYNVELGMRYLRQGNMDRSKKKFLKAVKQAPNWVPALNSMALYLEKTDQPKQAESYYLKALKIDDDQGVAQNNYGTFLCRQQRYSQAERYFMKAAQNVNFTNVAEAYENAGLCAMQMKNIAKAKRHFQQALVHDPRRANSLYQLAQIDFEQKSYFASQNYLDRYLKVSKHTPETLWLGIRIAKALNDDNTLASYALILRSKFSKSKQAYLLRKSGWS